MNITNCYSKIDVKNTDCCSAAFVGTWAKNCYGSFTSSYFAGNVTGGTYGTTKTFSGLADSGWGPGTVSSCYYDTTKTMKTTSAQGTGLDSFGSMTTLPSGFSSDVWQIIKGYPELKIFIK